MAIGYYPANTSKNQKYGRLYMPNDPDNECMCQVTFEECLFAKTDTHIWITGKVHAHTKGIEQSFKEHNIAGETVMIRLLNVPEHTTTYQGNKKTKTQSKLEKYLSQRLTALDWEKAYSGHIAFRFDGMMNYLLEGVELSDTVKQSLEAEAVTLTPLETKTIELEDISAQSSGGKGGGKGSYSQSEKDKLNDRLNFYLEQMRVLFPSIKLETIADLNQLIAENDSFVYSCLALISNIAKLELGCSYMDSKTKVTTILPNQKPGF